MLYSTLFENENKNYQKIQTNQLLVLCEIEKDYQSFYEDFNKLIKSKLNRYLITKLFKKNLKKLSISTNKLKLFINKHYHTLKILKEYSCLNDFTILCYDSKGKRDKNLAIDYFYQYITENKTDLDTIKAVALKIKELGFHTLYLNEKLNFNEVEYRLNIPHETNFAFLENLEIIPTYLKSPIKYKTNDSCYCLILDLNTRGNNKQTISDYDKNIILNTLIFNPNRLPKEITIDSTIGLIYELAKKKEIEHKDIRHSVDLSISTNDLKKYFEYLQSLIQRIDKIKNNQELMSLLKQMQNILKQLQLFGIDFEKQIISSYEDVTEETMKREKKLYLDRRYWTNLDID